MTQVGSQYLGDRRCQFTVWAPLQKQVAVHLVSPQDQVLPLVKDELGYWRGTLEIEPGALYYYRLDEAVERPDPASLSQPQGVHGPSEVVDLTRFTWDDRNWTGIPQAQWVVYELHVGTFTPEGTFDAIIDRLPDLVELGINCIELLPIAQFPGSRNWGYDGVYPYAVQDSYGGIEGLKRLVNACHSQGLMVFLDTVYNHLGPEGNYIGSFGPYFTEKYRTPWGNALNFDDSHCHGVRNFFIENALFWFREFHIDALRLDATDNIFDFGAKHFLKELAEATDRFSQEQGRKFYLTAESDLNDPRWVRPWAEGGHGLDVQWNDDFHHIVHALLTGEQSGYYRDYDRLDQLAKAYTHNFIYTWDFSNNRQRFHGGDPSDRPSSQFIVFSQNHDQVGNRLKGDRFSHLLSLSEQKLAAALVLLSPSIPLLFMGEEYAEPSPFLYFVSHGDPELVAAVRKGRKEEFAAFHLEEDADDPQSEATFHTSKLHWEQRHQGDHQKLWRFYQTLLQLRREIPALAAGDRQSLTATPDPENRLFQLRRWHHNSQILALFNLGDDPVVQPLELSGSWKKLLDSTDDRWGGTGSNLPDVPESDRPIDLPAKSVVIYSLV